MNRQSDDACIRLGAGVTSAWGLRPKIAVASLGRVTRAELWEFAGLRVGRRGSGTATPAGLDVGGGECFGELLAGGDAELLIGVGEVSFDRSRGGEEVLSDVAVGEPGGGESHSELSKQ
jgi:hypothetical protein